MTRHINTDPFEDDLDRSRARLRATLDALQDRVGIDFLAQEALGLLRHNAADYSRVIGRAVRDNPLAVALTGAGIAWLLLGGRGKSSAEPDEAPAPRVAAKAQDVADLSAAELTDLERWSERLDQLREASSEALRKLEQTARDRSGDLRDVAAERAKVLARFAEDMQASLLDGLDGLEDSARDRIVAAREAAYAARLRIEASARSGTREAERLVREHPMVAAVLTLALGAALGAALPRRAHTEPKDKGRAGEDSAELMAAAAELLRKARARSA